MFLRIANPGESAVEAFTVLGASSARGEESSIGQFGSGAKHAILCALRAGLSMLIYCGRTKVEPFTETQVIHGRTQQRVNFRIGTKTEASSMVLDFGSLDWTNPIPMMLRELISNALDSVGGDWSKIVIETVEKPRAKAGWTTVYVEWCHEVSEYLDRLHHYFLHVNGENTKTLLPQNPMPCKFYRKGVFVHEVEGSKALYSYNCGGELPIDESRNLDSYRVACHAARLLSQDLVALRHVIRAIVTGHECYEADFSNWYLTRANVAQAFKTEYGDDICITDSPITYQRARTKGLNVKLIQGADGWFKCAKEGGIPDALSLMSKAEADGLVTFPPSEALIDNAIQVWDCMAELSLTGNLEFPELGEFEKPTTSGESLGGFYSPSERKVFIHRECVTSWKVLIEEFAHYVTGANDETRDFQDYAFRLAGLLMRKVCGQ